MTRLETLEVMRALCTGYAGEKEDIDLADKLRRQFPNSDVIDRIFQDMRNLTLEQIFDDATLYEANHSR